MIDYSLHRINYRESILEAFKRLNNVPQNLTLFVENDSYQLVGTLTDGDVRRGFLRGLQLTDTVEQFMIRNFKSLLSTDINPRVIYDLREKGIKLIPIIDDNSHIVDVLNLNNLKTVLPIDAVIMAGGRGERLRPLTDKTPKPLLKVGSKPIIEHNIDHLSQFGIKNFNITVRYLGEQIESYFGDGKTKNININYIREDNPLGTIGALAKIEKYQHNSVLLMNADIFTNIDLEEFYNEFIESKADMAVASIPYVVDIPYAVLDLEIDKIKGFKEKPTYTFYSNAGIYLIKTEHINLIPKNSRFDATDFIQKLIDLNKKVIRFPILGYWVDIGKPEDFQKVQEIAKHISKI